MKYLLGLAFCVLLCRCGECDQSKFYQIKVKYEDGASRAMCRFEAEGLGPCTTWQKTEIIYFTDSCRFFALSQIVRREQVIRYR